MIFSSFCIRFAQIYQSPANTETRNTLKTLTVAASNSFNIYKHLTLSLCNINSAWRSSRLQMFFKVGALQTSANFTKKHLCQKTFFNKVQAWPATLFKKRLQHRCFPVKFAKFLRTPSVTASVPSFNISSTESQTCSHLETSDRTSLKYSSLHS